MAYKRYTPYETKQMREDQRSKLASKYQRAVERRLSGLKKAGYENTQAYRQGRAILSMGATNAGLLNASIFITGKTSATAIRKANRERAAKLRSYGFNINARQVEDFGKFMERIREMGLDRQYDSFQLMDMYYGDEDSWSPEEAEIYEETKAQIDQYMEYYDYYQLYPEF